jgi:hypothetical protein
VTSQKPILRWALADGTDGAEVEICHERTFLNGVTSFLAKGTNVAPATALAKGLYYWRLRGIANGAVGALTSPIWEFFVGARSASVNTSWGTTLDVNGDGYADVIVGADGDLGGKPAAYLYLGGTGLSSAPTVLSPAGAGLFGFSVASAGDVNGDGFAGVWGNGDTHS